MFSPSRFRAAVAWCGLVVGVLVISGTTGAVACALDSIPSMSMNGHLAVINKSPPKTAGALAHWSAFVFRARPQAGQRIHFGENRREVARSLTTQAMAHAAKWEFGDAGKAYGWSVSHVYRKRGTYRLQVLAYDRSTHKWYPFDQATVSVR